MTTIIVGGGIIGLSTAFYLATSASALSASTRIIIIDSSQHLFTSASGRAAGFLNRSWFDRPSASLAELSFVLHQELAEIYGGKTRWGYRPSQAWSAGKRRRHNTDEEYRQVTEERLRKQREGAETADPTFSHHRGANSDEEKVSTEEAEPPDWIFCDEEKTFLIAGPHECAQINPYQLCEFLLEQCISKGVEVLYPYRLDSLTTKEDGSIDNAVLSDLLDQVEQTVTNVKNVVIAAGVWTGSVFKSLFPDAKYIPAISPLAGYSMTFVSPLVRFTGHKPVSDTSATFGPPAEGNSDSGIPTQQLHPGHDTNKMRDACFVRSSGSDAWLPELFSRSNGEIYIAGLNEQGFHPALGTMAPSSHFESHGLVVDEIELSPHDDSNTNNFNIMQSVAQELLGPDITVLRKSVCLRPVTPGGEPIIGEVPPSYVNGTKGVYICAGHGPWGITLSLGSGKVIAELIMDGKVRSADISQLAVA
ncbi:FAD dependent oxidoreductase [Lipomyces kononenkoae]|uniref:FAD dependent oxidoreductase n=1 Tax=Lipomyces kononenkoae TaxID=34357 RepID=A0ACC3T3W3_LIPKO